jgi:hypothetical protein
MNWNKTNRAAILELPRWSIVDVEIPDARVMANVIKLKLANFLLTQPTLL